MTKIRRFIRPLLVVVGAVGAAAAMTGCAVYPAGYGGYGYYGGGGGEVYAAPPVYINGSINYSDGPRGGPGRGHGPRGGGWRR